MVDHLVMEEKMADFPKDLDPVIALLMKLVFEVQCLRSLASFDQGLQNY